MVAMTAPPTTSTRQLLADVGLALFAEHGYDHVTTEQIAAAAGVTQRTLFRHFATKLDLLFADADETTDEFVELLYRQPPGPVTVALINAIEQQDRTSVFDERSKMVARIVGDTPSLWEARRGYEAHFESLLAEWIGQRHALDADDFGVRVLAAMLVAARRVVVDQWRRAPDGSSVVDLARRALAPIDVGWLPTR